MIPNDSHRTLNVYITHWVHAVKKTILHQIRSASIELIEHSIEHFRRVGIPRQAHPIQQQLWNLAAIGLPKMFINIYCNERPSLDLDFFVARAKSYGTELEFRISVSPPPDPSDPFSLTGLYKSDLAKDVIKAEPDDLFMYLEHDQIFDRANLEYFLKWLPKLSEYGLLPGFLRIEWHSKMQTWVSTDHTVLSTKDSVSHVEFGESTFVDLQSPYSGMFLVDLKHAKLCSSTEALDSNDLVAEHLLRQDVQEYYLSLGTAERAALGSRLAHHRLMNSMNSHWFSAYPVGFNKHTNQPIQGACVWHVSNNYAKQRIFRRAHFGSIPLNELLV